MELYIAGGVGEHGRNCFFLQNGGDAILVDCGLMAGSDDPLPRLTESQIRKLKAVSCRPYRSIAVAASAGVYRTNHFHNTHIAAATVYCTKCSGVGAGSPSQ